ncbi:hypothetical protein [Streptosporangium roseum]|uniref:hypothetical protein n=1 Tax=Streptosporangium roseum TaxID=2001 RepID=UPI0001A3EAEB|nr:hypothetical protein [Streptosporangium roseum]
MGPDNVKAAFFLGRTEFVGLAWRPGTGPVSSGVPGVSTNFSTDTRVRAFERNMEEGR